MTLQKILVKVADWDFYYRASDDPRRYDEGLNLEKQLIKELKGLNEIDKHTLDKLKSLIYLSKT